MPELRWSVPASRGSLSTQEVARERKRGLHWLGQFLIG